MIVSFVDLTPVEIVIRVDGMDDIVLPSCRGWFAATLRPILGEELAEKVDLQLVEHPTSAQEYVLKSIASGSRTLELKLDLKSYLVDSLQKADAEKKIQQLKEEGRQLTTKIQEVQQAITASGDANKKEELTKQLSALNEQKQGHQERRQTETDRLKQIVQQGAEADVQLADGHRVAKEELEQFVKSLVPPVLYIHGDGAIDRSLRDFVDKLRRLRAKLGSNRPDSELNCLLKKLKNFLKSEVDVAGENEGFHLLVGGLKTTQLPLGTYLALYFFALKMSSAPAGEIYGVPIRRTVFGEAELPDLPADEFENTLIVTLLFVGTYFLQHPNSELTLYTPDSGPSAARAGGKLIAVRGLIAHKARDFA